MISLTSEPGDIVLDPFAGIGSVPAMADVMGRIGFGVEISQEYVDQFPVTLGQSRDWFIGKKREIEESKCRQQVFHDTIVELRLLKFGNLIGRRLVEAGFPIEWIHVIKGTAQPEIKHKIAAGTFEVKVSNLDSAARINDLLNEASKRRPLSKFGVEPIFQVTSCDRPVPPQYWYKNSKFWTEPGLRRPAEPGHHLTSDFRPRIEDVVEMVPYPQGEDVPYFEFELYPTAFDQLQG